MGKKIKILWLVNIVFPEICKSLGIKETHIGGWLSAYRNILKSQEGIGLCILSPYDGDAVNKIYSKNDIFYVFPRKWKKDKQKSFFKEIYKDYTPDVIHIFGTEYSHSLLFVEANGCKNVIVSIQGLISSCALYYSAGINNWSFIKNISLRDILKCDFVLFNKMTFYKRGLDEKKLISKIEYVAGRTDWDYYHCSIKNSSLKYFHLDEPLRESFYKSVWNIDKCKRHTIFFSQNYYPLKGVHKLFEALPLILKKYPDTEVFLCGNNEFSKKTYRRSSYWNYLYDLASNNNILDRLHFLGDLDETNMVKQYLDANVFVCSSSIENSSNSICEAQILGVPVVASYVGGVSSLIEEKVSGLLYRFEESSMLASMVCDIFSNDEMATSLSSNARRIALLRHDKNKISSELLYIYNNISTIK